MMVAPFPTEKAYEVCCDVLKQIQKGKIQIVQKSQLSKERENQGVMLGSLVCRTENGEEKKLITVSGLSKILQLPESSEYIFVEPVVSPEKINEALKENDLEIHQLTDTIEKLKQQPESEEKISELKKTRNQLCNESLEKVYASYSFYCSDRKIRSLNEICRIRNNNRLPPTGTGECCEPKLLNYAYKNNLLPESLCQIFVSQEILNEQKEVSENIPIINPCDERCGILLPEILGLKILYRDEHIIVVDKQSGVLSVPGRGPDKQDCIVNRVRLLFPECIEQPAVHRLDMETSGLLVLAFTKEAHRNINKQFEEGTVEKSYVALLDGVLAKKGIPEEGQNELYFRLDVDNRPHQIWDEVYGKKAVTQWKILGVENYTAPDKTVRPATRVIFYPHTGRTHQLRLASSDSHGFGTPIIGDTLYGHCENGERLMLHAQTLSFTHPVTGQRMNFECMAPF